MPRSAVCTDGGKDSLGHSPAAFLVQNQTKARTDGSSRRTDSSSRERCLDPSEEEVTLLPLKMRSFRKILSCSMSEMASFKTLCS